MTNFHRDSCRVPAPRGRRGALRAVVAAAVITISSVTTPRIAAGQGQGTGQGTSQGTSQGASQRAGQGAMTSAMHGVVRDRATGVALRHATIATAADTLRALTDSAGRFRLDGLAAGAHDVIVRRPGYLPVSFVAELRAGAATEYAIQLERDSIVPQELAPVTISTDAAARVSYRLADFERRRRTGRGQYLAREEIESSGASTVPDLTRGMRGVTMHCGGGGGCRIQMVRAPNDCAPEYVVDGRAENMFGATTPIRDIVGLEVYTGPSDVPGEFAGTNAGCGVVVIWTRAGPPPRKPKGGAKK